MESMEGEGLPAPTRRQMEILNFIRDILEKKGIPPTIREIGEAVGLSSSSTVHSHLACLERKGCLRRERSKPRSIEILGTKKEIPYFPPVGRIDSGRFVISPGDIKKDLPLPVDFVRMKNAFLLRVEGDSMKEAGILDGDYCIVQEQENAEDGEIIAALVDQEATVKKFYRGAGYIILEPMNHRMKPVVVKEAKILGKVVGLVRSIQS